MRALNLTEAEARRIAQQLGQLDRKLGRARFPARRRALRPLVRELTRWCLENRKDPYIFIAKALGMPDEEEVADGKKQAQGVRG